MKRLAIITTHPIQYYAPVFRLLTERGNIQIKVFYTWGEGAKDKFDPGFGKQISWDIPLLDGYDYTWVHNTSKKPGSHHHGGIVNPELIRDIESWEADAVLVFGWNYHSHWQVMKYFKGRIPVLFRGDSTLLDEKPGLKRLLRRQALTHVYRYVDKALYVGTQNKRYYLAHGLKEDQLVFAPHAVENERFSLQSSLRDDKNAPCHPVGTRQELGFSDNDRVILFAGKFESKKAPDLLLQALQHHNQKAKHALKLLLVGNGVLEEQLKKQAAGDENIRFLPFQNQSVMPSLYRVADVFCLPSHGPGETWGLAVNEAMASGRPVLVSDRCGCAIDLVKPGKNGLVVSAGDLDSLSEALAVLSKADLKKWGLNAQEDIKPWSFQNQCDAIENVLNARVIHEV